jgi:ABC-type branched-subunit amino acid transport system substrate-binding protein
MRRVVVSISVAVLGVALGAGCDERPAPVQPIKLGVMNPLSGGLRSLGPSWEQAARLAAEQVNAGGGVTDGRPLQIIVRDSATDPATAEAIAQELLDEGVVALVGPATSGEVGRVLPLVEEAQVPLLSCCATSAELSQRRSANDGFFFRTTPSDDLQGQALAFLALNGFDGEEEACGSAAIVYRDDLYGQGFERVFTPAYDGRAVASGGTGRVVANLGYPPAGNQEELSTAARDAVTAIGSGLVAGDNGELCVVVISFDADGAEVILGVDQELRELIAARQGSDPNFALGYHFLVGDGANSSDFARILGERGRAGLENDVLGTVPFHATSAAYDQYAKAFRLRYGTTGDPIAFTAQNYDAVVIAALAMVKAGAAIDDQGGLAVRNALFAVSGRDGGRRFDEGNFFGEIASAILAGDDVDYVGPSGEVTFSAFGDVVGDYVLWRVQAGEAGAPYTIVEREPLVAADFVR